MNVPSGPSVRRDIPTPSEPDEAVCVFRITWTPAPPQTGHLFHRKLDTRSRPNWTLRARRRGVGVRVLLLVSLRCQTGAHFSHGISFQGEVMRVMDEPVEDRVGQCGIADGGVPVINR